MSINLMLATFYLARLNISIQPNYTPSILSGEGWCGVF